MISREIFFSVCCVFATIYFTVGFDVDFEHFYYSLRENVFCELRNFVLRFRNWRKLVDLEKKMLLEFEFKICENGSSLKREYSLQKNPKNRRNPPQGLFTLHQQTKIQIRYFRTRKSSSKFHSCLKNPLHLKILCKSHWTW